MCTGWVKSLIAGLQLPPGHEGEAGTHFRKLKALGFFLAGGGISFGWAALRLAGWAGTQGRAFPSCICHAYTGTRRQRRPECGGPQGCSVWHKSNQWLSGLMKSILPFSDCSKMRIQPLQHILES